MCGDSISILLNLKNMDKDLKLADYQLMFGDRLERMKENINYYL